MLHQNNFIADKPIDEWAERNEHWLAEANANTPKRKRRERNSEPLILCGHGVSLKIDKGALVIRDGFTHYPQAQTKHRYFSGDLNLPPRVILLDGSGSLSFDVLSWLAEQGVALVRIKWTGEATIMAGGSGYAADLDKVRWQHETRGDVIRRGAFASEKIGRKLENSIATLRTHFSPSRLRDIAIAKARDGIAELALERITDISAILSIEGQCAVAYFAVWREVELQWKSVGRYPIPNEWRFYLSRSSILTGVKPKNWKAAHPINAMLNYAYAVKAAQLQIQAIADGYDPTVGILHTPHKGLVPFPYDMIEPERPKVDAVILGFIATRSFSGADFVIRSDGVCRLSSQLARAVASLICQRSIA